MSSSYINIIIVVSLGDIIIWGSDTMDSELFVGRNRELQQLMEYYRQCCDRNINCAVLLYGWRRVGKSAFVRRFVGEVGGIVISCSWISDPRTFLIHVLDVMKRLCPRRLVEEYMHYVDEEDKMIVLRKAFEFFVRSSEELGKKLAVALDEFHILVDKLSYRIARETKKRKEVVESDILWLLREFLESKHVFWILLTSIGWAKLKEMYFSEAKGEKPLSGVVIKMRLDPLSREESIELAMKLNPLVTREIAEVIYEVSGGIPRIIEILSPNYRSGESPIALALKLTKQGQFDEVFENIVKFIAEVSKRDYTVFVEVLKAMTINGNTPEAIAKSLHMDRVLVYNILEDLRKMDILEKKKVKGRVYYSLKYPLLRAWLELRIEPRKTIIETLASELGITAESYIRELFEEYLRKRETMRLYDDDKGTFLAGTAKVLQIKVMEVYSRERIAERLHGLQNADLIIVDENNEEWLVEVKATLKPITTKEVRELAEKCRKLDIGRGILIQLGLGNIELGASAEAVRQGMIIITREGIRLLAKKIGMPKY